MRCAAALVLVAACAPPAPPAPLSSTAPATSRAPVLLYWVTASTSHVNEVRWVDAYGTSSGRIEVGAGLLTLFSPVRTPHGTWLVGQSATHGDAPWMLVRATRTADGVELQQARTTTIASVSPGGSWAVYPCERGEQCAVAISGAHLGAPAPVAGWLAGDTAVGWRGDQLVVTSDPGSAVRDVLAVDLATGARRRIGGFPDDDEVAALDPDGRAAFVFDHGTRTSAYVATLDRSGHRFAVESSRRTGDSGFLQCFLPVPETAVCSELRSSADHSDFAIVAYTADGRRDISTDSDSGIAVAPEAIAYSDKMHRLLIATDLRGEHRRVLAHAPPGETVTPIAWLP